MATKTKPATPEECTEHCRNCWYYNNLDPNYETAICGLTNKKVKFNDVCDKLQLEPV